MDLAIQAKSIDYSCLVCFWTSSFILLLLCLSLCQDLPLHLSHCCSLILTRAPIFPGICVPGPSPALSLIHHPSLGLSLSICRMGGGEGYVTHTSL